MYICINLYIYIKYICIWVGWVSILSTLYWKHNTQFSLSNSYHMTAQPVRPPPWFGDPQPLAFLCSLLSKYVSLAVQFSLFLNCMWITPPICTRVFLGSFALFFFVDECITAFMWFTHLQGCSVCLGTDMLLFIYPFYVGIRVLSSTGLLEATLLWLEIRVPVTHVPGIFGLSCVCLWWGGLCHKVSKEGDENCFSDGAAVFWACSISSQQVLLSDTQ